MSFDGSKITMDWRLLLLFLALSGVGGGAGTKAALLGYPPPEQIATKEYVANLNHVRRDELLVELRTIQGQLATINTALQVTISRVDSLGR